MVRMLLGLPELSCFCCCTSKITTEGEINFPKGFFNAVLASKEFLYYVMCFSVTVLAELKLYLLITSTFIFPELRIFKKCY